MNVQIRRARTEDFSLLPALYSETLGKSIDERELIWRFAANPLLKGELWNYVAEDAEGKIVAHSAYIPMKYRYRGNEYVGALSAGSMALPSAGGWFAPLYQTLETYIRQRGADFLFAFPNPNSFPFFVKVFGFEQRLFTLLQGTVLKQADPMFQLPIDEYLANALQSSFLQWRCQEHPFNDYGRINVPGLACITKPFGNGETDLIAVIPAENKFVLSNLFNVLREGTSGGKVNLYVTDETFARTLEEAGFKAQTTPNRLVVRVLNPRLESAPLFLQMVDSDIF